MVQEYDNLAVPSTNSKAEPLFSDAKSADGINVHFTVLISSILTRMQIY